MTATANPSFVPDFATDAEDLRESPRTAMFVAATAVSNNSVQPVRVRNMSRDGALLEGPALPAPGEEFELVRAHLSVSARTTWAGGNQCGVSFKAPIDVAGWMARITSAHQQQVDALVHQARLDIAAGRQQAPPTLPKPVPDLANIQTAIELLEGLEGALADDALLIARHQTQLQALDRALQLLRVVAPSASPA